MNRPLHGAIAGFCATMAMTTAMRLLERGLDRENRYPLPPREITEEVFEPDSSRAPDLTLLAHFGFGALAGTLYGLLPRRPPGLLYGPLVWATSYLGWLPSSGTLSPATRHPVERNMLMVAAHFVWGAFFACGMHELDSASRSIFAAGYPEDRKE